MKPVLQVSPKAVSLHYAEGQTAIYDLLRINSHTLAPLLKHKMSGLRVQKFFVVRNKWLNFGVTWFFHRSSHWRMRNDVGSDWGTELWTRHLSFLSRTCSTPICHGSLKQNWFSLLVSISKSWSAQQASANLLINPVNVISQATGSWSMFPLTRYTWRFTESQRMFKNILCAKWYLLALFSNFPRTLFLEGMI